MTLAVLLALSFDKSIFSLTPAKVAALDAAGKQAVVHSLNAALETAAVAADNDIRERHYLHMLIDKGNELFPDEPAVLYWRAHACDVEARHGSTLARSADQNAEELWSRAIERAGLLPAAESMRIHAKCHIRLGQSRLADSNGAKAAEHARCAIALSPLDIASYDLLVDTALRTGRIYETVAVLHKAAYTLGGRQPDLWSLYFEQLTQLGESDELARTLRAELARMHSWDDRDHFLAVLAEAEGNAILALAHHFSAVQTTARDRRTTRRSQFYVDQQYQLNPRNVSGNFGKLLAAWRASEHRERARTAIDALDEFRGNSDAESLFTLHIRATAWTTLGKLDLATQTWREAIARRPDDVSAACQLAEALEALGQPNEADTLFAAARARRANNWKVEQVFRLGATLRLDPAGVRVAALEDDSLLGRAHVPVGAVFTQLEGEALEDLPPLERMRLVRMFQGGPAVYRTTGGHTVTVELPAAVSTR